VSKPIEDMFAKHVVLDGLARIEPKEDGIFLAASLADGTQQYNRDFRIPLPDRPG